MHRLKDPARLACIHIERDECGAVLLLLIRAQRRVVVAGRVAHRQVDETELFVADARRPHVRRAQRVRLAVRWQLCDLGLIDVPGKAQLTGHRVVPSDDARCRPAALTIEHAFFEESAYAPKMREWNAYGGGQSAQRYSELAQITPANVKDLKRVWTFHTRLHVHLVVEAVPRGD